MRFSFHPSDEDLSLGTPLEGKTAHRPFAPDTQTLVSL
jgi:hypothetical protein